MELVGFASVLCISHRLNLSPSSFSSSASSSSFPYHFVLIEKTNHDGQVLLLP